MAYRLLLPAACVGLLAFSLSAFADQDEAPQQIDTSKLRIISSHEARTHLGSSVDLGAGTAATGTLPVWTYQVTATQNNTNYSGAIVGGNPATATTTTVPTVLVPLIH